MPRNWRNYIDSIIQWFPKEVVISKRLLRLRTCVYLKIPWIETNDMIDYLITRGIVREVKDNQIWLAPPEYLDGVGQLGDEYVEEFRRKKNVYDRWNAETATAGYYAEKIVKDAFVDAGYSAQKIVFDSSDGKVEIDAYCMKEKWHLGVQVKNITSDVIINPGFVKVKSDLYKVLVRQFDFCSNQRIVPILMAPFIESSFYVFDDMHRGLHDQTLLQFFPPGKEDLCKDIREILHFGNVRTVAEIPQYIREWISRIPQTWENRFGTMKNSFAFI